MTSIWENAKETGDLFDELKFKSFVLNWFISNFPEIPTRMRLTLSSYSDRSPNCYHLEDDVWSHTLMVLKGIDLSSFPSSLNEESASPLLLPNKRFTLCLMALCHDIGKIYTRGSHKPNRVGFFGHAEASTQDAINIGLKAYKEKFINYGHVIYLINVVSNHNNYYQSNTLEELILLLNKDQYMAEYVIRLFKADFKGRYTFAPINRNYFEIIKEVLKPSKFIEEDEGSRLLDFSGIDVWMFCGIPGSGKDHQALSSQLEVFSYDNIIVDRYLKLHKLDHKEWHKDLYNLAWLESRDLDVTRFLKEDLVTKKPKMPFAICNVHSSRKSRTKVAKMLRSVYGNKLKIGVILVLNTLDNCLFNNRNRKEKTISEESLLSFAYKIEVPTFLEDFETILFIINNHRIKEDLYGERE